MAGIAHIYRVDNFLKNPAEAFPRCSVLAIERRVRRVDNDTKSYDGEEHEQHQSDFDNALGLHYLCDVVIRAGDHVRGRAWIG